MRSPTGTLVSVGVAARAGSNIEATDLWAKNNALRGVLLGGALGRVPSVHAMIAELIARVGAAELRVVIDRTFKLDDAADAHEYMESPPDIWPRRDDAVVLAPEPNTAPIQSTPPAIACRDLMFTLGRGLPGPP